MARVRPYLSCDVALSICTTCLRKIEAKISGGEPTAHPDFFAVLAHAKARPIRHLMVNTNGVKIAESDDFAKRLAGRGHHRVRAEAAVRPRRQDDAVRDQIFKLFATNHSPASGAQVDGHDAHAHREQREDEHRETDGADGDELQQKHQNRLRGIADPIVLQVAF